jgi:hypothetical protein
MTVANALAYFDTATIMALQNFIVQAPGTSTINFFDGKFHADR